MRVQTFIFNWPGKKQHAVQLEKMFRPYCDVSVINSDDSFRNLYPHWRHIGNDGYFTEQWNAALSQFKADIFLHIQADIWPHDLGTMLPRCIHYMRDCGVGVYAPDLDFNPQIFSRKLLPAIGPGIYEVPTTDNSFWAIRADVVNKTPPVNPKVNRFGWGIDFLVAAVAKRMGRKVVRDYRFRAGHPRSRGYNNKEASEQWSALKETLDPDLRDTVDELVRERNRLVINNDSANPFIRGFTGLYTRMVRASRIARRRVLH